MRNIFIGSDSQFCGKTMVAICLALEIKKRKKRVGYFKPCGTLPVTIDGKIVDSDIIAAIQHLNLKDDPSALSPVLLTRDFKLDIMKGKKPKIKMCVLEAFEMASKGKSAMVIEGGRTMEEGRFVGYPTRDLIEDLDADVVLVEKYEESRGLDNVLELHEKLGDRFKGFIMNKTDPDHVEFLSKYVTPYLEKEGVPVLGVLRDDPLISSVSVAEISEALGGNIVAAKKQSDLLVEQFLIGAMSLEAASRRFRILHRKAVVTGGDRPDLQVAALDTSTRCLILTGGISPHPLILTKAEERKIPIIISPHYTINTMAIIDELVRRPHIKQKEKIVRAQEIFTKAIDMKRLGF